MPKAVIYGGLSAAIILTLFWLLPTKPTDEEPKHNTSASIKYNMDQYIEKMEGFVLNVFADTVPSYRLTGETFYSFEGKPSLFFKPNLTIFSEQGEQHWLLTSDRAYHFNDQRVKLEDNVLIRSLTDTLNAQNQHTIETNVLWFDEATHQITSDGWVSYQSTAGTIEAESMVLDMAANTATFSHGVKGRYE